MNFVKCKNCQREYFETDDKCPFCGHYKNEEVNSSSPLQEDNNTKFNIDTQFDDFEIIVHRLETHPNIGKQNNEITINGKPVTNPIQAFVSLGFVLVFLIVFILIFFFSFTGEGDFLPISYLFLIVPLFMIIIVIVQFVVIIQKIKKAKRSNIPFNESLSKNNIIDNKKHSHECVYYDSFAQRFIIYSLKDEKYKVKLKDIKKISYSRLSCLLSISVIIDDKKKNIVTGYTSEEDYLKFKSIINNRK
ncbi:MAG: hypothetical protein ACI31G_00975 [Bacilli bacterium]